MEEKNMEGKIASGLFWKILENGGIQGVQLIVSLVLTRILLPEDYDLIALVTIFITICNVVIQYGFNTSLVQKKNADDLDFSTVIILVLVMAAVLYSILFIAAPFISDFYDEPRLTLILRVLSINILFCGLNSILYAKVAREMRFRRMCLSCMVSVVLSGTLGIILVLSGVGVWAIVGQQISYQVLVFIILGLGLRWFPGFKFSVERARSLFSFGWKILLSSLIDTVYNNSYGMIIGKRFPGGQLAFYNKGDQFPQFIVSNLNASIQAVILPVMSSKQDKPAEAKALLRESIKMGAYVVFPMMTGLALVARPLIILVLTENWVGCVPFLQILCFSYILWPVHTANLQAVNGMGRSDMYLKLEIIKKIIGVLSICISIKFGIMVMVALQTVNSFIGMFLNMHANGKILNYGIRQQVKDILPVAFLTAAMGAAVYCVGLLPLGNAALLTVQMLTGISVYLLLSRIFKISTLDRMIKLLKNMIKRQNG